MCRYFAFQVTLTECQRCTTESTVIAIVIAMQRNLNLAQFFLYLSFSTSFSLIWCVLIMGYSWLLYRTLSPDFIFESYYITTKLMITIEYPDNQGSPIQSDLLMGFTQYCWQCRPGCLVAPALYNRESFRNIIDVIVNRITSLYLESCINCILKKKYQMCA